MTCPIGTRLSQRISLGASSNDTRRDTRNIERLDVIKGTTISFTSTATIGDSGNGMGSIGAGNRIQVRGSESNSRVFTATAAAAGSLTAAPALVTTVAATPAITLVRVG